jgi:ribonuclease P protein subunit POP4
MYQKPIQSLLPTTIPPPITSLLSLRPAAYTQKVLNKALNFHQSKQAPTDEAKAVKGRKKNRGDSASLEAARQDAREKAEERRKLEVPGRGKRKRTVLDAGQEIEYVPSPSSHLPPSTKVDSYERVKPLHHLHTIYLSNLLNLPPLPSKSGSELNPQIGGSTDSLHSKLSKADFTGAHLRITTAKNPSLNGITGLVIEETASTFRLVTPKSIIKVIPKNGTQFDISFPAYAPPSPSSFASSSSSILKAGEEDGYQSTIIPIPPSVMEDYINTTPRISIPLLGTNFGFRSGDRAGRKFRPTQGGGGGSGWGEEWVKGEWSEVLDLLGQSRDEDEKAKGQANGKKYKGWKERNGGPDKPRRGKSRRKDPPAFGSLEVSSA